METLCGGFHSALSALHMDSRVRGNDMVCGGFETRPCALDHGACRGAKPLCVTFLPPRMGDIGG
jgi:hypothetical protein